MSMMKKILCVCCNQEISEKYMLQNDDGSWICEDCAQDMNDLAPSN